MIKALALIPTYNEVESLPVLVDRLLAAVPELDVLVLDDASPDGTGELADAMAAADPRITVRHRPGKLGLGAAYLDGFAIGIERGYTHMIEIDADGSHPPERLRAMLDCAAAGHELVIGSRWMPGGSVVDWPLRREALSRGANLYARLMLGVPAHDMTAGYRVYSADLLRRLDLTRLESRGYCFQIDMTVRAHDAGATISEVPIEFRDREAGESKMSGSIIGEALTKVTGWGIGRRAAQLRAKLRR